MKNKSKERKWSGKDIFREPTEQRTTERSITFSLYVQHIYIYDFT